MLKNIFFSWAYAHFFTSKITQNEANTDLAVPPEKTDQQKKLTSSIGSSYHLLSDVRDVVPGNQAVFAR